jgi:putative redox protein
MVNLGRREKERALMASTVKATTSYRGGMRFESGVGDARVVMDAPTKAGGRGEGLTPKAMVLQGLIGCTGLDVAAILQKREVVFEDLRIDAEATQTRTAPAVFEKIEITFHIKANPSDREHVEKAITVSQKHFCGVSAMLRKGAELTWTLDLQPL